MDHDAAQRHGSRLPTAHHPETIMLPTRVSAFRRSGNGASGMRATLKSERSGGEPVSTLGSCPIGFSLGTCFAGNRSMRAVLQMRRRQWDEMQQDKTM